MRLVPSLLLLLIFSLQDLSAREIRGSEAIEIGGIKQWIKYQGADDQAPVLLFLHGGPGNSMMSYADRFTKELQKNFIVVLWDQRESGKTKELNKSPQALTVSLFISDAIEVVQFLTNRFSQGKIYVAGHSWGGYLGLRVAVARPELLKGYFAISPMINQLESERLSLKVMLDKAKNENNSNALAELGQVEIPFKNARQLYYHRKWLSKLMNSTTPTWEKVEQWSATWLPVFNEASQTNFFEFAPELNCPVYFLIGSNDYQTYFKLADSYYQQVVCQEKKLYWFTQSAHSPNLTESSRFQDVIISIKNKN
jgi:pimeloyl-ACP methyl ester carboxylesterase